MRINYALVAGLLLLSVGRQASSQPEPWSHPDGSVHYYCPVAAPAGIDWFSASDSSERLGGYLATITSQPENDFVFGLVDSCIYWYGRPSTYGWAGPWLGARQRDGAPAPDSGWEWVSGETFSFVNWSPGQPNDLGGDQNRLNFGESPFCWLRTWNDVISLDTVIHGYVVELSAESTTIGLLQNDAGASVGYSLFQSSRSRVTYLIDNKGRYVHSWYGPYLPALSVYLREDGKLLRTAAVGNTHFTGGWAGGRVELLDWESNLLWAFDYSNDLHCQHHDVKPLPNGNILMLAWEAKTRAEALAAGRDPGKIWDNEVWADHIIEVNPKNDSIVWQWHAWNHLVQDFDSTKANYGVVAEHSELVDINYIRPGYYSADWMHSNTVDYNPQFDQIILNVRDLSEIWVIDHSTTTAEACGHEGGRYGMGGDILYRWGNPQVYRAGGAVDEKLYGPHEAVWVESGLPGAGHITVFNNGEGRPDGTYSTVDEFIPACDSTGTYPRPEPGTPFGPSGLCWTYAAKSPETFYSKYMSGARRLPNGNTLICEADSGLFFEVTPDSQIVWSYVNPVTDSARLFQGDTVPKTSWCRMNSTFRVTHYAPDYKGLAGRDLAPGLPIERYRPPLTGIQENKPSLVRPRLSVSPNPFRGSVIIALTPGPSPLAPTSVRIFDAAGRLVRAFAQSAICNPQWSGTAATTPAASAHPASTSAASPLPAPAPPPKSSSPTSPSAGRHRFRSSTLLSMFRAKHRTKHVGKHRQRRREPRRGRRRPVRRQLHWQLDNELRREPREPSHAALHDEMLLKLLAKLHHKTLATLFDSSLGEKPRRFNASIHGVLGRRIRLPRRPPGHGAGGRIVVRCRRTTTYGMCVIGTNVEIAPCNISLRSFVHRPSFLVLRRR